MALSYTLKDASRESGLSVRKLYALIGQSRLQSTLVDRRRLVLADSLKQLLTENAGAPVKRLPWIPKKSDPGMVPEQSGSWEKKRGRH
jgi:hypothetical protein